MPKPRTQAIHAGEDHAKLRTGSIPSINMSTTNPVDPNISFSAENLAEENPFIYTRWGNPTITILEEKVAALENGEAALAFSSGIAAVTGLMLHKLKTDDRMIVSDIAYAGVREFGNGMLPGYGIEVVPVNLSDLEETERVLKEKPVKMVFAETPCNPIVRLTNIQKLSELCKQYGAELAVDSTFASPMATQALDLGADFVIHSLTKYIGGHGDAVGGIVVGKQAEIGALRIKVSIHLGGVISPFNAWLINRGIATLPLRMQAHSDNAQQVAEFLESHPAVRKVIYPGLTSHPQHNLAKEQMGCFSGMLTFQVNDPEHAKMNMANDLKVFHYAVSLGHHKSLIFYMSTEDLMKSSFRLGPKQLEDYKRYAGEGIFRVSIGLEDPDDLCEDLARVL